MPQFDYKFNANRFGLWMEWILNYLIQTTPESKWQASRDPFPSVIPSEQIGVCVLSWTFKRLRPQMSNEHVWEIEKSGYSDPGACDKNEWAKHLLNKEVRETKNWPWRLHYYTWRLEDEYDQPNQPRYSFAGALKDGTIRYDFSNFLTYVLQRYFEDSGKVKAWNWENTDVAKLHEFHWQGLVHHVQVPWAQTLEPDPISSRPYYDISQDYDDQVEEYKIYPKKWVAVQYEPSFCINPDSS